MSLRILDASEYIECGKRYYPTLEPPQIEWLKHYDKGHDHAVSKILMPVHTATHVDAPLHFVRGGSAIDQLPLARFIGVAQVINVGREKIIDKDLLETFNIKEKMIIFKTGRRDLENYSYLTENAAKHLVEQGVRLIGIESPSVDKFKDKKYPAHKILLNAGVIIVEGLNLERVDDGRYFFVCLPLRIKGVEGAPCRAVLIDLGELLNNR